MPKKPDPTVSSAIDGIFVDATSSITSKLNQLRSQKDSLNNQKNAIDVQIESLNKQIDDCINQLKAVDLLKSSKDGTLYP